MGFFNHSLIPRIILSIIWRHISIQKPCYDVLFKSFLGRCSQTVFNISISHVFCSAKTVPLTFNFITSVASENIQTSLMDGLFLL